MSAPNQKNLRRLLSSIFKISFFLIIIGILLFFLHSQFLQFQHWFLSYYGTETQQPIWDFLKMKWWLVLLVLIFCGLFLFLAFSQIRAFARSFGKSEWEEPTSIQLPFRFPKPKKLFPINYLDWVILYLIIELLKPTTIREAYSEIDSRDFFVALLTFLPPLLLFFDSYACAVTFRNSPRRRQILLFTHCLSTAGYFWIMWFGGKDMGSWTLQFVFSYALFFIAIPLSFLFGLRVLKR